MKKDLFTVIPTRSMFVLSFIPVHCALRYTFLIYTEETFQLLVLSSILLSLGLWLGKSRLLMAKALCHAYVGLLPVLIMAVSPDNVILAGCSNFLSLMFMTIMEDDITSLFILAFSNSISWSAFAMWMSSNVEKYRETEVNTITLHTMCNNIY